MKRSWLILLGGLLIGLAAYACIYFRATAAQRSMEKSARPELAWLQKEYQLTDAQLAQVIQLHEAYHPKCAEMCRRIDEQNAKIQQLLDGTNAVTPEITKALAEAAQLRAECESAMLQHFFEVSHAMPPDQGKRYLSWVQEQTLMPGQMAPTAPPMRMEK
jgi:Tfp pilus assembly protein PilN